ncbi:MAG: glycosyltransferase family 2 protein [Microgenomates group bacterium]
MPKLPKNKNPILSVIILDYNALTYLHQLFQSICRSVLTHKIEVILVDNDSQDNSLNIIQDSNYHHPQIEFKYLQNGGNIGFAAGNNRAVNISNSYSKYILFLNPDTTVEPNTLQGMIDYLEIHPKVDTATCHVTLALTGKLQPECHRDFPTPLNAFLHFSGISSRLYFMQYLDYTQVQKINACVGAFYLLRREVGESVGWWNEKYFMYGEDLDFCYKVKQKGYSLYFIPFFKINHYQGISSGIKKAKSAASRETKIRSARATTNAMRIFYRENLINNYPKILQSLIYLGINLLEYYRVFKAKFL